MYFLWNYNWYAHCFRTVAVILKDVGNEKHALFAMLYYFYMDQVQFSVLNMLFQICTRLALFSSDIFNLLQNF